MTDYITAYKTNSPAHLVKEAVGFTMALETGDAVIDRGVIRWTSNNRVPPQDVVKFLEWFGEPIDIAACDAAREEDIGDFLAKYRKAQASRTADEIAEQRAEARAAVGSGVTMVNIFTGEKYTT